MIKQESGKELHIKLMGTSNSRYINMYTVTQGVSIPVFENIFLHKEEIDEVISKLQELKEQL